MTNIPIVPPHGTNTIRTEANERVHLPESLSARLEHGNPCISLRIEVAGYTSIYPLSPPTAKRLAKELRQAVRLYLDGPEME